MGLFGRSRGQLTAQQQAGVLQKVVEAHRISKGEFSVRQAIANALTASGFDDKGIGCPQELAFTTIIGLNCGVGLVRPEQVEQYCQSKDNATLAKILSDSVRYLQ